MGSGQIGRSEPAFLSANNCTPPTYLHGERPISSAAPAVVLLHYRPTVGRLPLQGLCRAESPPAVFACSACSAGCVPVQSLPAIPTALLNSLPRPVSSFCFALPLFMSMCARIVIHHVCKLRELSRWQLQHGPAVAARAPVHIFDLLPFPCRVHGPGPWW